MVSRTLGPMIRAAIEKLLQTNTSVWQISVKPEIDSGLTTTKHDRQENSGLSVFWQSEALFI